MEKIAPLWVLTPPVAAYIPPSASFPGQRSAAKVSGGAWAAVSWPVSGFPAVRRYGLPVLEQGLARGKSPDEAGCAALLAILAHTDDTNMIARGEHPFRIPPHRTVQPP